MGISNGYSNIALLINGKDVQADSTFPVKNPLTQETIYTCSSASVDDARQAVEAAEAAFISWRKTAPSQRRMIFMKAAEILLSKAPTAHELMSKEVAAAALWRNANLFGAANFIREAAAVVTQVKGEILPTDRPGTTTYVYREPVGVVFSIVPWNAPLNLALRAICLPIACGNTVVLKPSEYTPASQRLVVQAFAEAGLPPGVLNFLPTSASDAASVTESIVRAKEVRRVNFTGSTRVGKIIARWAAEELKPCIFELGGKASVIVMEDAKIDEAVKAVVFGGMMNSGQLCM
jgi:acyl-CoA reductase-like NAD-dependent aldehyde dehydrogenase